MLKFCSSALGQGERGKKQDQGWGSLGPLPHVWAMDTLLGRLGHRGK